MEEKKVINEEILGKISGGGTITEYKCPGCSNPLYVSYDEWNGHPYALYYCQICSFFRINPDLDTLPR